MAFVIVAGIILLYTFNWMNRNVLTDKLYQLVSIIAPIAVGVVILWILSAFSLSKRFIALTDKKSVSAKAPAGVPIKATAETAAS